MLRWIAGDVADVFCRTATRVNAIEVEDCAALSLRMASGALVTSSVTLGAVNDTSRLRFCFQNLTAESGLEPYAPGNDPWTFTPRDETIAATLASAMAGFVPEPERFAGQFAAFHAALSAGGPPPVTVADARASLELLTAAYGSAAAGNPVALPLTGADPRYGGWGPSTRS
jgi:predicted dehydrogenase